MKYAIIHFSTNWMMDGLAIEYCNTPEEVEKYIRNFKSKSTAHKNDKIIVTQVLGELKSEEIDHGLYGFKLDGKIKLD